MRRRSAAILALVLLAAAGAGYLSLRGTTPVAEAPAGPRQERVTALGRIEPRGETFNLGGSMTDVLKDLSVDRGSTVARGQTIGHFRGYDEAVSRAATVRAQLAEAVAQRDAEKTLGEARVRAAQTRLDSAVELGAVRVKVQEVTIKSLEVDLDNNIDILEGRKSLYRTESGTRRGVADQEALVERARANLETGRARLVEVTRQAAADTVNAEAALGVDQATLARTQAQIPVASLERQVVLADAQAAAACLVSPIDGTVLNVLVRPGAAVGMGGPIVTLGDTSAMVAVAEVYETDVGRVRVGQRASVTATALERPLTGTVIEVGRIVYKNDVLNVDPAARTDARVVQVRVALDDGAPVAGLTNLTVDVAIDTGTPPGAGQALSLAR